MISFFFFFSSRRRHTRCSRDWSSDVCSSDLEGRLQGGLRHAAQLADGGDAVLGQRAGMHVADAVELLDRQRRQERLFFAGRDHAEAVDRKSTRLNSSHGYISYAVFCLQKKNTQEL